MLLRSYDMEMRTMACDCHVASLAVFAHLHQDVAPVLPYLNAVCPGAVYDHATQVLTCKRDGREVGIRPREVAIADVEDREDAARKVDEIVALINDTWDRHEAIAPNYRRRQRPPAMALYKLLPGGNCRACGEATCFIFAMKLSTGAVLLEACPPILSESYAGQRASLAELLSTVM